jgi:hypothetical protein
MSDLPVSAQALTMWPMAADVKKGAAETAALDQ